MNPYLAFAVAHVTLLFGGAGLLFGAAGVAALWATSVVIFNFGDSIDSVTHLWGVRPYPGEDQARNNGIMAFFTLGEGWHAHHHRFPWSARHGLGRWQLDWTHGVIRVLEAVGLARNVRRPEAAAAAGGNADGA